MKTGFSVTTLIRAAPGQIFGFLADPSTAPVIDPAVTMFERNAVAQQERVRRVLEAAVRLTSPEPA